MRIEVTKTMPASPDGIHINQYVAGEVYEMTERLASVFLTEKWGKKAPDVEPPDELPDQIAKAGVEPDPALQEFTLPDVRTLIADVDDVELLQAYRRGEEQHPQHQGGRKGVLEAIDARIAELEKAAAEAEDEAEE
jgi:hypothetical protein